ncbi:MAG: hypothetical protein JXB39_12310 [Deltaproteobacteria bacterium]|nr:hypothetical protein [Deltaproteobacteria bacterium]
MSWRWFVPLLVLFGSVPRLASATDGPSPMPASAAAKGEADEGGPKEASDEEREKAAAEERKKKDRMARVIVLRWKDTRTDYLDDTVRRNVRSRIDRPDALFFPEMDLYQNGRKLKDKTVVPAMQPARVPDANLPPVSAATQEVAALSYNALKPHEWGLKAQELAQLAESIWFVDRKELREPLFGLYTMIGKAAENANNPSPPFFEYIGGQSVNYYWYLAACLAQQDPAVMGKVADSDIAATLKYYLDQLQQGAYPTIKVDFELDDSWDAEAFDKTWEILFNGMPVVPDENAQVPVFLGRTDIYLKRKDTGHGLSERLEVTKLDDKFYPVMQNARKRMGIDFIDQLFLHPNECSPELDGDILTYLSIYARLHASSDVYVSVPQFGNANKVLIWRYDRKNGGLNLVGGSGEGFPVRFAAVFSTGAFFNGASPSFDPAWGEGNSSLAPDDLTDPDQLDVDLLRGLVPFSFELRVHYSRLMVNGGFEAGYNVSSDADGFWEYYQTDGDTRVVSGCSYTSEGALECDAPEEALHQETFNRNLWLGLGVLLGSDAGIGFGPRIALRMGFTNLPHAFQPELNVGWALQPPMPAGKNRMRPLVDVNLRGGASVARERSLQMEAGGSTVIPVLGLTAGVGSTF